MPPSLVARHKQPAALASGRGFTLIELVMTTGIVTMLAVVALPRLVDTTMWRLQAYADQLQNQLRTAQRLAITQRRPITATIASSGVTFTYASGATLATLNCPSAVPGCIAESGIRSISFNSANSGQAVTSTGGSLTVTVSGGGTSTAFTVENDTGAVH